MKKENTLKKPAGKQVNTYRDALDAFVVTSIVFLFASLLSILDKGLALGVILFYVAYVVTLIRWKQQRNN